MMLSVRFELTVKNIGPETVKYSSFSSMVLCGVGISWWTIESSFMPNADWLN